MNTALSPAPVSLRHGIEPSDRPVSNHPPPSRRDPGVCYAGLTGPHAGAWVALRGPCVLGFASRGEARHGSRPNRVHARYGPIVHLRLLPTPPCGDAVTIGYGVPGHSGRDFHPADSMRLQAHPLVAARPGQQVVRATPRWVMPTLRGRKSRHDLDCLDADPDDAWGGPDSMSGQRSRKRRLNRLGRFPIACARPDASRRGVARTTCSGFPASSV
jgi:hypothetical protein